MYHLRSAVFMGLVVSLLACTGGVSRDTAPGEPGERGERGPRGLRGPAGPSATYVTAWSTDYADAAGHVVQADVGCDVGVAISGGCYYGEGIDPLTRAERPEIECVDEEGVEPDGSGGACVGGLRGISCYGIATREDEPVDAWVVCAVEAR